MVFFPEPLVVTSNYVDATDCKFLEGSTDENISNRTNGLNGKKIPPVFAV